MNQSSFNENDQQMILQLAKAQKTLDDIEFKMKKFKSRKKQQESVSVPKAPFPDLNQYFSFLSQEYENKQEEESINYNFESKQLSKDINIKKNNFNSNLPLLQEKHGKQNEPLSINQKLQIEKNSSIGKIEQYYMDRNEALEIKIKELRQIKQKVIRDQRLLLRNNEELEEEIKAKRGQDLQSDKIKQLKDKIQKMRNKIGIIDQQNRQIGIRKKQLQKYVKQAQRIQKLSLGNQIRSRPKSNSHSKCKYH